MTFPGTIGFLGFGNMAQAIFRGLVSSGTVPADQLAAHDVDPGKIRLATELGGRGLDTAAELARESFIVVLALKPQDMEDAISSIRGLLREDALVISIAAGISVAFLEARLGPGVRVARVMPNTPALVGVGAAGFSLSASCTQADAEAVRAIFESIGMAVQVPESAMDAVTALSGSGPAYYFRFVETFIAGAVELGLSEENATLLATQTLYGAGKLLAESGEAPQTLRARVTSKGGTTAAALDSMHDNGLDDMLRAALRAAAKRSEELGQ